MHLHFVYNREVLKVCNFKGPLCFKCKKQFQPLKVDVIRWVKMLTVVRQKSGTVAINVHFHFEHAICHLKNVFLQQI
jgi:hypothetical protein